jgi:hypothetical protein
MEIACTNEQLAPASQDEACCAALALRVGRASRGGVERLPGKSLWPAECRKNVIKADSPCMIE